jgi:alpha,alpha-trehalase
MGVCCTLKDGMEGSNFRKEKMNELCWNEESSMYFDYDFVNKKQFPFETRNYFSFMGWNVQRASG